MSDGNRSLALTMVIGAVVCLSVNQAAAEAITYSCELLASEAPDDLFMQVDQVAVDLATKTIELRVSKSIGTTKEAYWIFGGNENRDDFFDLREENGDLLAAGLYGHEPFALTLRSSGSLVLARPTIYPSAQYWWSCEK